MSVLEDGVLAVFHIMDAACSGLTASVMNTKNC